jgi:hypothetical protein
MFLDVKNGNGTTNQEKGHTINTSSYNIYETYCNVTVLAYLIGNYFPIMIIFSNTFSYNIYASCYFPKKIAQK